MQPNDRPSFDVIRLTVVIALVGLVFSIVIPLVASLRLSVSPKSSVEGGPIMTISYGPYAHPER